MQSAHDVDLSGARIACLLRLVANLIQRMLVRAGLILFAIEGAELAAEGADVRVVEMAIDVVVRDVAVQTTAHEISERADGPDVGRLVQQHTILACEAHTTFNLVHDGSETLIKPGGTLARSVHGSVREAKDLRMING